MLRCPGIPDKRRTTSFRTVSVTRDSASPVAIAREAAERAAGWAICRAICAAWGVEVFN